MGDQRLDQRPAPRPRLVIRRRLVFCGALAALGAAAFLPFLIAGGPQSSTDLVSFAIAVTVVASLAAWLGLRCADAVGLPMPWLRRLDGAAAERARPGGPGGSTTTLVAGLGLGGLGVALLRVTHAAPLPGTPLARALSTLFAAGPLELVLHLGVMSVVVWFARGRRWVGILAAALALVAFHLSGGALSQPTAVVVAAIAGNATIGLALGWLYARYGFEYVMLGHAVAHLITVLAG